MFFLFEFNLEKGLTNSMNVNPIILSNELKSISTESIIIIDTRPAWKYLISHIPGAIRISNWMDFSETRKGVKGLLIKDKIWIARKLAKLGISHDKKLIIYGDSTDPWRTDGRFFWMFKYYGFKKVALLDGGLDEWVREDGDLESGTVGEISPSNIQPKDIVLNEEMIADQKWIIKRLHSDNTILIDNRTRSEYDGATPYGSLRGGHIPGAKHVNWQIFFKKNGRMKKRSKIIAILKEHNIPSNKEIAVYCTGGVRSGMAFFVLEALGFKVRNYDGSWWDWSSKLSLPTEPISKL